MNFWVNDIFAIEALKAKRVSDKKLLILYGLQVSDQQKAIVRQEKRIAKEEAELKSKEQRAINKANKAAAKKISHLSPITQEVWDINSSRNLVAMLKKFQNV